MPFGIGGTARRPFPTDSIEHFQITGNRQSCKIRVMELELESGNPNVGRAALPPPTTFKYQKGSIKSVGAGLPDGPPLPTASENRRSAAAGDS
jgi:hypothetical protein